MRIFKFCVVLCIGINLYAQEDTIKKSDISNLTLEELLNLNVYTASKKIESFKDAPAILSLITKTDIENYGAFTLIDVLKYIPSLEVSMGSDGNYNLALRGSRKDGNILVLMNGQQLNDFYSGKAFYDLPSSFIDRIEIIRGPGSALFGTNALSGIINIFTVEENTVNVSFGPDLNANVNANFYVEENDNSFSMSVGYAQNNTNNRFIEQDKVESSIWSLTHGENNYETNRWNNDLYINSNIELGNFNLDVFSFYRQNGAYVGPTFIASPDSKYIKSQTVSSISYKYKVGDNVIITPKLYSQLNYRSNLQQESPDNYFSVESGDTFTNGKLVKEEYLGSGIGGEVNIYIKANENFDFLTGSVYEDLNMHLYNLQRNYKIVGDQYMGAFGNYDNITFDQNGKRRMVFAYYVQTNYKYKKINLTTGLRYDDYSDFGQALNPRIGINYELNKSLRIKGLFGKAFRAPTFKELYDNTTLGNEYGVKGNVSLSNESISSLEVGAEFTRKNFSLRYNLFYLKNSNLIRVYDPHGGGGIGEYENIGNTNLFGHEAEMILKINQLISFNLNFSHFVNYFEWKQENVSPADYVFFQNQEKYNQELRNMPTLKLNSGLIINYKKFMFFLGANFGNNCENNKRFFLEKNHYVEIPYYLLGNFNVSYKISKRLNCSLSANNIGVKYSDPDESTNINAYGILGLIQPGPMYLLNFKYSF